MPSTPNTRDYRGWRTLRVTRSFSMQKWEHEPFLRIRRDISVSGDFRKAKFQYFYWPELQNVTCPIKRDSKIHLVP